MAINQQLQQDCEKAASDILKKEDGINERDEKITKPQFDLFNYIKGNEPLKKELSRRQNVGVWEKRACQLEAEQREVQDLLKKAANVQPSMELMKENNQVQKALQESKQQCHAVEEKLSKQLAEEEERHQLQLSETAEKFRQDLLEKDKLISEKEASLQEVITENIKLSEQQCNHEGNVQPQELLTEKETKK